MKIKLIFLLIFFSKLSFAQSYIDKQQERIDALDGTIDNFLRLIDLDERNSATYTYITLVDKLQEVILDNNKISNDNKVIMFKELHKELFKIDENRLTKAHRDEKRYTFLLNWIISFNNGEVNKFMDANKDETFNIINYIYPYLETKYFLQNLPNNYIDQILYNYKDIRKTDYGQKIIENVVAQAPITSKKYFIRNQPVYNALFVSTDPNVNIIMAINEQYRRNTKAYVLLDKIMNGKITIEDADEIGKNKENYFKNLLEIRAKKNPLAEVSLDRELNYEALEYVREVNHLHESSSEVRFKLVNNLKAEELYTLMVYSEDEIFTSSFNGIYERFVSKTKSQEITGFQLLENVGFNRFRTFIKMISYYGKLNEFLNTMTASEKEIVLRKFIGGIAESKNKLEDAVSIANAVSVIEEKDILLIFEEEFYSILNNKGIDNNSRLIYSLLIKLFNPKVQNHHSYFDSISNLYFTPPIDKIPLNALLGEDGKNVQKHFFYDDEDGVASYNSFKATFNNSNWKISDKGEYITIQSTNGIVKIYANKPANDETAWYYANKEMEKLGEIAEIIIHRGHSYYVEESIEKIPKSTKLIVLGSCGGYNRLSQLLEKSNNAQIISTKQIGSMAVNNPLIYKMAEKIRKKEDLDWATYWNGLKIYFKDKGRSKERFEDYVPPHQNLGAKFIAAYNMYKWIN